MVESKAITLLAVLLVLLAAAVGWVSWSAPGGAEPGQPADPPAGPSVELQADGVVPGGAPAVQPERAGVAAAGPSAGAVPELGSSIVVVVVNGETRRPVADALVRFTPADFDPEAIAVPERTELDRLAADAEVALARIGAVGRTDLAGEIRIALPRQPGRPDWQAGAARLPGLVCARSGSRYGQLRLYRASQGKQRLFLFEDRELRVRVEDDAGQPLAGMGVLWHRRPVQAPRDTRRLPSYEPLGNTGADGRLRLPHFSLWVGAMAIDGVGIADSRLEPDVPGQSGGCALDPGDPPAEEVVLRVGPTGTVAVELTYADGSACRASGWARVEMARDDDDGSAQHLRRPETRTRFTDSSRFALGPVGLGAKLDVVVARSGRPPLRRTVLGPTRAGETVTCRFEVERKPMLVGTVLDAGGRPVAKSFFRYCLDAGDGTPTGFFRTDDEGNFRTLLPGDIVGQTARELMVYRADAAASPDGAAGRKPLALRIELGDNSVGSIALGSAPVLVAGRSMDASGAPVELDMLLLQASADGGGGMVPLVLHREAEGHFTAYGWTKASELQVTAIAGMARAENTVVPRGQRDVEIVLGSAGRVRATVLAGSTNGLVADMVPEAGGDAARGWSSRVGPGRYVYRWWQLSAGTYRLELRLAGESAPLLALDGLQVESNASCSDPRLDEIDLSDRLHAVVVRVVDPAGRPIAAGTKHLFLRRRGEPERAEGFPFSGARTDLVLGAAPVDVLVSAPQYQLGEAFGVTADRDIVLRPQPVLSISVAGAREHDLAKGERLLCSLQADPPRRLQFREFGRAYRDHAPFDPSAVVAVGAVPTACRVAAPGSYRVELLLVDGTDRRAVGGVTPTRIEVADVAGQPVVLHLPAGALEAARQASGGK